MNYAVKVILTALVSAAAGAVTVYVLIQVGLRVTGIL